MLYEEMIDVCSDINTKHVNALCGQNVEFSMLLLAVLEVTTGSKMFRNVTMSKV
jgi:hypothetical protein